ncbi:MAG: serine hydrolase domain-containing protein, partial [Candidatus Thorarchaeota archaeon]
MDSSKTVYSVVIIVILFLTRIPTAQASILEPEKMDYWPTDEWKASTPESQGMDSIVLNSMVNHYNRDTIDVDSLLVVRNGYIVLEAHFSDSNHNNTHHIYSCTKSITSTLIGIAITRGLIESTDLAILDILSDFIAIPVDEKKQQIRIEHLLTMSTGLEWNEDYSRQEGNDYYSMIRSENWIEYVLDKSMVADPNSAFLYNSGASHLLSAILQVSTGNTSLDFARQYLFNPLGIVNFDWETDPLGIYRGESMMQLVPFIVNWTNLDTRVLSS